MTDIDVRCLFLKYWQELAHREDWIDLGMGMPSAKSVLPLWESQPELSEGQRTKQSAYQPQAGEYYLREAVAQFEVKRTGLPYTAENIMMVSGALRGFSLVLDCLANNHTHFVEIIPTYPVLAGQVRKVSERLGCTISPITPHDQQTFRVTADEVIPYIKPSTILYYTNPNNPTGLYLSKEVLAPIVTKCEEVGAYIILDQACDIPLASNNEKNVWSNSRAVIRLLSLSKTYLMAGFRMGYIVAHPDLIRLFSDSFAFSDGNAPIVANSGLLKHLRNDRLMPLIAKTFLRKVQLSMKILSNWRSVVDIITPEACFYIFLKIDYDGDSWHIFKHLLARGVNIVPGCLFGLPQEPWIRICCAREDDLLLGYLHKLKKALDSLLES